MPALSLHSTSSRTESEQSDVQCSRIFSLISDQSSRNAEDPQWFTLYVRGTFGESSIDLISFICFHFGEISRTEHISTISCVCVSSTLHSHHKANWLSLNPSFGCLQIADYISKMFSFCCEIVNLSNYSLPSSALHIDSLFGYKHYSIQLARTLSNRVITSSRIMFGYPEPVVRCLDKDSWLWRSFMGFWL